jgi:glutamine synthetase
MSDNAPQDPNERIIEAIKRSPHDRIKVAVTDIDGILRGKYMLKEKFLSAVDKGFGFCDVVFGWDCADVCYDNVKVTGWHSGYPDAQARIDLSTHRTVPWDDGVPFLLADFEGADGTPSPVCPRQLLKRIIGRATSLGCDAQLGLEFEWFNFRETPQSLVEKGHAAERLEPLTPGMFGYSVLRSSLEQPYFRDLMEQLGAFGVPLEGLHTETGPGVYEAAIRYSSALEAADRAALFKTAVKEIAYRHGVIATFMARWNTDLPGCSGHIHQSLCDPASGANLFSDPDAPHGMSPMFRHYLAGQMRALPELLPMLAPTINSYKRLVEGYWAPTRMTWGIDNRTTALRVILGGASTRVETRIGGADLNPYLAVSAALAAGLYGIQERLELDAEPITGNGYEVTDATRLPQSLEQATERMANSDLARALLGDDFVDHFTASRDWECRQYRQAVTDWELKRYLEII